MSEAEWVMQVESRLLKRVLGPPARLALRVASWVEGKLWGGATLCYSPVFIVAPPRAGTTLLYQLMTSRLATSFFTNLAMRMHVQGSAVAPVIGAQLLKWFGPRKKTEAFKSYYGATKGWEGPHEGHWVWNQFFPEEPHAIPAGYLSARQRKDLYRMVAGTERVFDRPFVSKHIRNSVRIAALTEVFPTALHIRCMRNPLDVAQSIYVARTRDFPYVSGPVPDPARWWFAVKPREYAAIKDKGLIEQVCEQVYFVEQNITEDCAALEPDRLLVVKYRDLCRSPRREMARVVEFMNAHNAPTEIIQPIPESFPYSTGCKIDPDVYSAMADYLSELFGRPITPDSD